MTKEVTVIEPKNTDIVIVDQNAPMIDKLLVAAQNGLPVETLEKFMDLTERNERREAEKAYHKAFADFKANPPKILKDAFVSFKNTAYKHASLGNVVSAIIESMSPHGLSHSWHINQEGSSISVTCKITHSLGHFESTTLSAAPDNSGGKNFIQAVASTVTYLERYTLQAATGIAVLENDDDGQGVGDMTQNPEPKGQQSQGQSKPQKPKDDQARVEQWVDYLQNFEGRTKKEYDEAYKTNLEPKLSTFSETDQSRLDNVHREMEIYLEEKEKKQ